MSAPKFKTMDCELARSAELGAVTPDGFEDVSIMSIGPARGHGMRVDEKTVSQFIGQALGKSMPAYLTHTGATEKDEDGDEVVADRLGNEIGLFSGFYRDGESIRAKQFTFLDSFKRDEPKLYSRLLDLARTAADQLGISPVVSYIRAWVREDGSEVPEGSGKGLPADLADPLPAMRIRRIFSLDFVKSPATNAGLFDEPDDSNPREEVSMTEKESITKLNEQLSAKDAEIASLSATHTAAVTTLNTNHAAALAAKDAEISKLSEGQKAKDAEIATLKESNATLTKQRDDAKLHDMRLAGAPALTVALEAKGGAVPEPTSSNHQERWAQYATLCDEVKDGRGNVIEHKETPKAKAFREKYLSK